MRVRPVPHLVIRNLAMAGLVAYWCMAVSINSNREQEAFNRGAVWLTALLAAAHLIVAGVSWQRDSRRASFFLRFGGALMLIGGMLAYTLIASFVAGRML